MKWNVWKREGEALKIRTVAEAMSVLSLLVCVAKTRRFTEQCGQPGRANFVVVLLPENYEMKQNDNKLPSSVQGHVASSAFEDNKGGMLNNSRPLSTPGWH